MSSVETSRVCCVCKKVFCCIRCRERHQKKHHTEDQLKCPLCTIQKFPLQTLDDKSLFCHIVTAHLPLHCTLCGELFKYSEDLESFGTCKWWKSRHRHSLISGQKSELRTPPLTGGNENDYNGNFESLTSPPELYRNTSTPMVVGQKCKLDLKTPTVPDFSMKTPKTNSPSLKSQNHSDYPDSTTSNYVSFPSSASHKETPLRSVLSSRSNTDSLLPRSNSRKLGIMKEQEEHDSNVHSSVNHMVEDMELTGVEGEVVNNFQRRRSDSLKKVRFSDQYDPTTESSTRSNFNGTENEEFFEACDTLADSRIQVYEEKTKNVRKENCNSTGDSAGANKSPNSTRVVMLMIVENSSSISTNELLNTGLKKLECITSQSNQCDITHSSSASSSATRSVDTFYSITSQKSYSTSNSAIEVVSENSTLSNSSVENTSSGGLFYTVANVVKSVVNSISAMTITGTKEITGVSQRDDADSGSSTSDTFAPMSEFVTSLVQRPGKRPRDTLDNSPQRQMRLEFPQLEPRSPLPKRHRGKIKGRDRIPRMLSPRGVSSETQVFHQGSLSVGDTVLPLPSRAHQSTQTE
ncbi:uncharacterized protein LOC144468985 [Augochlora pura]